MSDLVRKKVTVKVKEVLMKEIELEIESENPISDREALERAVDEVSIQYKKSVLVLGSEDFQGPALIQANTDNLTIGWKPIYD